MRGEKTSEKTFYNVLMKASNNWQDTKVFDYCCAESLLINEKGKKLITVRLQHQQTQLKDSELLSSSGRH